MRVPILLVATLNVLTTGQIMAAVVPPTGLAPGSQYQLIFVTADLTGGESFNTADYNAFVSAEAALNPTLPATSWHAIVSTAIDAKVNAPNNDLPVYDTQGVEVSSSATGGLYSWTNHLSGFAFDQFGNDVGIYAYAWTGSDVLGTGVGAPGFTMGFQQIEIGYPQVTNTAWISGHVASYFEVAHLYALSDPITVPAPEPASIALAAFGFVCLMAWDWRRRKC